MELLLSHVCAAYGDKQILSDVSARIGPGLHVILGSNGAGKTTLFRISAGALNPVSGSVRVDGRALASDQRLKAAIGYLGHHSAFMPQLTVRVNLEFWARVMGLQRTDFDAVCRELADSIELDEILDKKVAGLSRGQQQRASLARVLIARPRLIFLDEPTSGLDPLQARRLRSLLRELAADGRTICYSTHNLYEIDDLATSVAFLKKGELIAHGPVNDVRRFYASTQRSIIRTLSEPPPAVADIATSISRDGAFWALEVIGDDAKREVMRHLIDAGVTIRDMQDGNSSWEEMFERVIAAD